MYGAFVSENSLRVLHPRYLCNISGALTLVRLPLAVIFPFIAHRADFALAVILLAGLSDALDGPVAKRFGTQSHAGGFADGWVDKIFNINAAWSLVVFDWAPWWIMLMLFTREFIQIPLVPYYVARYCRGEIPVNIPHWSGKLASVSLVVAMCAALLNLWYVLLVAALLSACTGGFATLLYAARQFRWQRPDVTTRKKEQTS